MSVSTIQSRHLQLSGSSGQPGSDNYDSHPMDLLPGRIIDYGFTSFRYQGVFCDVAQCRVLGTEDTVAIKIFKKMARDSQQPKRELDILNKIQGLDPVHIVKFYGNFDHEGQTCLIFEMLDKSLHELLRERRGEPLSLHAIRPITQQLLSALHSLKTAGIIHTNINPHNVMLVKQEEEQQPFRVKLINFCSAIPAAEVKSSSVVQPVGYRPPDVLLGLPMSEAVDMWSVGAVLSTLFLGSPLFPQRCHYHLMKALVKTLGQPDGELLSEGTNTQLYFKSTEDTWTLKTPKEYKSMTGFPPEILRCFSSRFNSLSELVELYPDVDTDDSKLFVSLLMKMLHLNPQKRISPSDALKHSFLSLSKEDSGDSSSHDMVSAPSVSVPPVETSSEEGDASTDSAAGAENVPAVTCEDQASDEAAVWADAAASSSDDTVPPPDEASESSAVLDAETTCAEEDPAESPEAALDEAALTSASTIRVHTDLYDAVSADQGPAESPTTAELNDEVVAEAPDSRKTPRRPLKRIRRFFGRVFRTLCCCCSVQVTE